jgi:site-specific DNA-methyltransferase (adenine-specific)
MNVEKRTRQKSPSGIRKNEGRIIATVLGRGGVTPFNLLPIANTNSSNSGGAFGHGAASPHKLMDWWIRYLSKSNDLILDPFCGSGTTGIAARNTGRHFICGDKEAQYVEIAQKRLSQPYTLPMFDRLPPAGGGVNR